MVLSIYEKLYPFPSKDTYRKKYRSDFYLIDYDVYLEHFGINKNRKTQWLTQIVERKYIDGIEWKRKQHKADNTKLIETYSYFSKNGKLISKLDILLADLEIAKKPIDYSAVYKKVFDGLNNKYVEELKKLIITFS